MDGANGGDGFSFGHLWARRREGVLMRNQLVL